jgi:hypothetical protein
MCISHEALVQDRNVIDHSEEFVATFSCSNLYTECLEELRPGGILPVPLDSCYSTGSDTGVRIVVPMAYISVVLQ